MSSVISAATFTTLPTTTIAGGRTPSSATRLSTCSSVELIVRCVGIVPSAITETGVSGLRPYRNSSSATAPIRSTAISSTSVPELPPSSSQFTVVDIGVAADLEPAAGLLPRKVGHGTADFTEGPAMTRDQAMAALVAGAEVAAGLVAAGNRCLVTGDMGIANTTASAALICAFTGADPADATGRGTGIDAATYARKIGVVCRGLDRHKPDPADPVAVLAAFGGFEHAALAGFILGAAAARVPVILDGVIAGAAALAAVALAPDAVAACFAGHRSAEPGHAVTLGYLGLRPLVDLGLRLGEGTGAVLALPLVQSAARALRDVATFDSAGVADKH